MRLLYLLAALVACQPKQPLQASFYTAKKTGDPVASCGETLACYAKCDSMTEECMLLCDQKSHPRQVEQSRAVTYCGARHGCTDQACTEVKCPTEMHTCTAPPVIAPAPTRLRPRAYPGQVLEAGAQLPGAQQPGEQQPPPPEMRPPPPMQPPPAMQPPPVMQPQPYPGQPPPAYQPPPGYRPPPPMPPQPYPGQPPPSYRPPPPMQPQPYPGQPPPSYRPPPPPPPPYRR
ncbi:MAG TPA: hypothetical protein VIV11_33980 [Kofleriaceae bacterium]